jgi:hypothetical protein
MISMKINKSVLFSHNWYWMIFGNFLKLFITSMSHYRWRVIQKRNYHYVSHIVNFTILYHKSIIHVKRHLFNLMYISYIFTQYRFLKLHWDIPLFFNEDSFIEIVWNKSEINFEHSAEWLSLYLSGRYPKLKKYLS